MNARLTWVAPTVLFVFALAMRVLVIWHTRFDGLYGQDPFAYLDYSVAFKTALTHGQIPPPFFWSIGFPSLVVVLSFILPMSVAAQIVSIVAGALVTLLVFLIVREILDERPHATIAALFAGGIIACSGRWLISSVIVMSDAAALFWATLSAYSVIRYGRTRRLTWVAIAGFALGWAIITRWVYALLLPVWLITLTFLISKSWKIWMSALGFLLLALLPQGVLMVNYISQDTLAFIGDAQVYSWNPWYAFQSDIVNADGHFTYAWSIGNFYSLPLIHLDYVPIWFTPFIFLGTWSLRRQRTFLILLMGWFVVEWGFLIGVAWENWRFPLAFFPPLAILVGVGLNDFLQHIPVQITRVASVWFSLCFIVTFAWGLYNAEWFIAHQLEERAIATWVEPQLPRDATILTFNVTATLAHFTSFRVIELASETPQSVERIARASQDVFVVLNVENVESQWQGLAPQINFQTLQTNFALRPIATRGAYTLYSVSAR